MRVHQNVPSFAVRDVPHVSRAGLVLAACLLLAGGCGETAERASAEPVPTAGAPAADRDSAAFLRYLADFDDEGIIEQPVEHTSAPGPHFRNGVLYADARAVAALLAPGVRVGEAGGVVEIDGEATGIRARRIGDAVHAPVRDLARRFGAYTHFSEGGATVWPRLRLCEYYAWADPRAAVFAGAQAEGLFQGCPARSWRGP